MLQRLLCWLDGTHLCRGYKFVRSREFDTAVQRAVERAPHRIRLVDFLDHVADVLWYPQPMVDENSTNDEDAVIGLYFAAYVAGKRPSACLDIPRCQRGGKGALQSGRCGGNNVIDRRGARLLYRGGIQTVVLGDCAVNAKVDRHWFCRQVCDSYRPRAAVDFPFIYICWFGHRVLLFV